MPTFPKLQRNITYKNYIIDLILSFIIVSFSSSYIYFPLLIGLFITLNMRISFILPFLFFTTITHSFIYFSLIIFYFIYKKYIYLILEIKLNKNFIDFISIVLVYLLYFLFVASYYTIQDIPFNINHLFIYYYILIEEFILIFIQKVKI